MTDAFAEAAAQNSAAPQDAPPAPAAEFIPAGAAMDMDDPFATSSQLPTGGGNWDPRVPFEDVAGRLVVMIPKSFRSDAPNPFPGQEGQVREEFRIDLVVLDGGPLEYDYNDRDPQDQTKKILKTAKVNELPFLAREQGVAQGSLIGKLKAVCGLPRDSGNVTFTAIPRLYLGVMAYAPYSAAAKRGATIDTVTAEVNAWISRGRKGTKPEYTWLLDDRPSALTPERRKLATAWWNTYRATQ